MAIRARLLAMSPVTSLVASRVWTGILPQEPAVPAAVVTEISEVPGTHLRGPMATTESRVQVDAWATTKASADALAEAINGDGLGSSATGLRGWVGSLGSPAFDVQAILPGDARTEYFADEKRLWRVSRDYRVFWRQT
jgi:hypothetical protein